MWSRADEGLGFSSVSFVFMSLSFGGTPEQVCCCHCLSPDTAPFFLGAINLYLGYINVPTVHTMVGCLGGCRIHTCEDTAALTQVGFVLLWKDFGCLVSSKDRFWSSSHPRKQLTAGFEGILCVCSLKIFEWVYCAGTEQPWTFRQGLAQNCKNW